MSEPYTPTTEEVCDGFRGDPREFEQATGGCATWSRRHARRETFVTDVI